MEQPLYLNTIRMYNSELCIDPFGRDQSKIRDIIYEFTIDKHTEITFDMLPMVGDKPNAFTLYMYPKRQDFTMPTIF